MQLQFSEQKKEKLILEELSKIANLEEDEEVIIKKLEDLIDKI